MVHARSGVIHCISWQSLFLPVARLKATVLVARVRGRLWHPSSLLQLSAEPLPAAFVPACQCPASLQLARQRGAVLPAAGISWRRCAGCTHHILLLQHVQAGGSGGMFRVDCFRPKLADNGSCCAVLQPGGSARVAVCPGQHAVTCLLEPSVVDLMCLLCLQAGITLGYARHAQRPCQRFPPVIRRRVCA